MAYTAPLLDGNEEIVYPHTKAAVVFMTNNQTAESAITEASSTATQAKETAEDAAAQVASKATTTVYKTTIGTSWTGSEAPYSQVISLAGILESDTPIVDVDLSGVNYADKDSVIEAFSKVYRITTSDGSITVLADDSTTTNVPIQLKVVR